MHITLKNVSQMLTFSSTYNAKQLQECCMEFICLNLSAILESHSLDDLNEVLLKKLSEFYCEWNPILQQRIITPYSTAPEDEIVLEVAQKYPFVANDSCEIKPNKSVAKKRIKNQKNKVITNVNESNKENIIKEEHKCESTEEEKLCISPSAPVRIEAINIALERIATEPVVTDFTVLPTVDLESLGSFPELGSPPTNCNFSKSPKSHEKFECKTKIVKLSQKQRKRLSSESCSTPTQSEMPGKKAFSIWVCFLKKYFVTILKKLQKIRGNYVMI